MCRGILVLIDAFANVVPLLFALYLVFGRTGRLLFVRPSVWYKNDEAQFYIPCLHVLRHVVVATGADKRRLAWMAVGFPLSWIWITISAERGSPDNVDRSHYFRRNLW